MKNILIIIFALISIIGFSQTELTNRFKCDYPAGKLPDNTPKVFAPGLISTAHHEHSSPTFAPDGKEIYWSVWRRPDQGLPQVIMYIKRTKNGWSKPMIAEFSGKYSDGGPQLSKDGKYLFYYSRRPVKPEGEKKFSRDLYYVKRTKKGWSTEKKPNELPTALSYKKVFEMYGLTPIVKVKENIYKLPELNVDLLKNKGTVNWTFCLSKKGDYIIFSSNRPGSYDKWGDLYISFKKKNGNWTEPVNMGDKINTNRQERFPGITPDGKYLFFNRNINGQDDIYWVNASIIDRLKKNKSFNMDTIVDTRDGQEYKTVKIGKQWWMAENMNFKINDGSWYYNHDSTTFSNLGRLYNWESAMKSCPTGWHLPSDEEWKELEMHLGFSRAEADKDNLRGINEGGLLKSTEDSFWEHPNKDASNKTGFSALGGGYRGKDGNYGRIKKGTSFWTSSDGKENMAWFRSLHHNRGDIHRGFYLKSFGYYVRCVKSE